MTSHGQVLKPSYKKGGAIQGTQGARGRAVGAARIPEGHLNPQSKFPKLPRSNHGTLKFQNENPHLQNRCRWWCWSPRSMSVRVWIPKINVREGLGPQDRWRRGLIIFQKPKVNVPDDIWYIDFGYTWWSWFEKKSLHSRKNTISSTLTLTWGLNIKINAPDLIWYIENLWFWGLNIDLIFGAQK